ncbi:MAG: 50S ribosomal protein L29 [Alphaproteobacteria bacterium GM7ARS4]|nr:50S ribosomal protein L29 [Alphaproteobacteria bacterium GM7ARS4]
MKPSDMRAMGTDELCDHLKSLAEQSINMRFQRVSSTLDNTSQLRLLRRDYARARTILHQRKTQKQKHKEQGAESSQQNKEVTHHGN